MKLYHVSEEADITKFVPRIPHRKDVGSNALVWALNERCLPNFLTPRNCPRVTYHVAEGSVPEEIARFFSCNQNSVDPKIGSTEFTSHLSHVVAIEHGWHTKMLATTLYVYEFDPTNFYLQDEVAGYYVSEQTEIPVGVTKYDNLYGELFRRGVEVRLLPNLWQLGRAVQKSTLNWSLCRMANALSEVHQ